MPSAPSLPANPTATLLRWAIPGTGLIMALVSALLLLGGLGIVALSFLEGHWEEQLVMMFIPVLLVLALPALLAKVGWDMFRNINEAAVANFAFLVAFILCRVWYRLLPAEMPAAIARFCRENDFLSHFMEDNSRNPWTFRGILAVLAFFVFYNLIKAWFLQKLGMDRPDSQRPAQPSVGKLPSSVVPYQPLS